MKHEIKGYLKNHSIPREYHEREADYKRRERKAKSAHREMIFKDEADEWI